MTFSCKWGCGTLLDTDPSITTVTGRRIPLSGGIPHDCHLSPLHKGINSRLKAKAVAKSAIQHIDDFQLMDQAKAEIAHINNRLANYKLVLSVERKQTQLTGIGEGALEMSYQYQTEEQKTVIEEDRLNRQTPFDPRTQIYPADLFILEGFDFRRQPIWVRNPRWHDDKGYFIGRSK